MRFLSQAALFRLFTVTKFGLSYNVYPEPFGFYILESVYQGCPVYTNGIGNNRHSLPPDHGVRVIESVDMAFGDPSAFQEVARAIMEDVRSRENVTRACARGRDYIAHHFNREAFSRTWRACLARLERPSRAPAPFESLLVHRSPMVRQVEEETGRVVSDFERLTLEPHALGMMREALGQPLGEVLRGRADAQVDELQQLFSRGVLTLRPDGDDAGPDAPALVPKGALTFAGLLGLQVAAWFLINGYHFGLQDQSIHLPYLMRAVDPSFLRGDPLVDASTYHPSFFWKFQALCVPYVSVESLYLGIHVLSVAAMLAGTAALAQALLDGKQGQWAAMVAPCLVLLSKPTIAAIRMMDSMVLNRTVVLGPHLFALALAIQRRYLAAFAVVGLAFLVHPTTSLHVAFLIWVAALCDGERRRDALLGPLLCMAVASPLLLFMLSHRSLSGVPFPPLPGSPLLTRCPGRALNPRSGRGSTQTRGSPSLA